MNIEKILCSNLNQNMNHKKYHLDSIKKSINSIISLKIDIFEKYLSVIACILG